MVLVSPTILKREVEGHPILEKALRMLERSQQVQAYLSMANVIAVQRLLYNDHGPVHSRIVAGSALNILNILMNRGFIPSVVRDGVGDEEDSRLVVMVGAYLHDIGNAVHREFHNLSGVALASRFLPRMLNKIYGDPVKAYKITSEILHCIFSHDENINALSLEAGVVKVADGVDMAGGRARIPYKHGKSDIHALSALAIKKVEIVEGEPNERPIRIVVDMENEAGVFQIEEVLGKKIMTSGLSRFIEIEALKQGMSFKIIRFG